MPDAKPDRILHPIVDFRASVTLTANIILSPQSGASNIMGSQMLHRFAPGLPRYRPTSRTSNRGRCYELSSSRRLIVTIGKALKVFRYELVRATGGLVFRVDNDLPLYQLSRSGEAHKIRIKLYVA